MTDYISLARDLGLYVHADVLCTFEMFRDPGTGLTVYWQEGISHALKGWMPLIANRRAFFITTLPWHHDEGHFQKLSRLVHPFSSSDGTWDAHDQFVVLCNGMDELDAAHRAGFRNAIACHHNCLLDWNLYAPDESIDESARRFDLVVNCRPERWKRPEFAAGVPRLAIIKGYNFRPHEYVDLAALNPDYINPERLPLPDVIKILNTSRVGGIFSAIEGGCYSSSEYLLCGLPVVSTPSRGGRDVFYDSDNSALVNSPSEVGHAVQTLIERCQKQPELRSSIRRRHVEMSVAMRQALFDKMNSIAAGVGLEIGFAEVFAKHFRNKMTRYTSIEGR